MTTYQALGALNNRHDRVTALEVQSLRPRSHRAGFPPGSLCGLLLPVSSYGGEPVSSGVSSSYEIRAHLRIHSHWGLGLPTSEFEGTHFSVISTFLWVIDDPSGVTSAQVFRGLEPQPLDPIVAPDQRCPEVSAVVEASIILGHPMGHQELQGSNEHWKCDLRS